jgi:hypothetical protein
MSYQVIFTQGTATVTVPAGQKIAVQAFSPASVFQQVGFPNFPDSQDLLTVVENTTYVSPAFTNATIVTIQAGASGAFYSTGTAPTIGNDGNWQSQPAPANIADGGSMVMTAANLLTSIITATPTASHQRPFWVSYIFARKNNVIAKARSTGESGVITTVPALTSMARLK